MSTFALHAFISYAHIDNQPLLPGKVGWVSLFHGALAAKLAMCLGGEARIWRDDKLRGDDIFDEAIVAQFAQAALLVSVLTPRYLRSEWCTRELGAFESAAQRSAGLEPFGKSRVLKVVKTPLPPGDRLPPSLDRTLGVTFVADDAGHEREIDPVLGEQAEAEFLKRVIDLAALMAEQLRALGAAPPAVGITASGQSVFVAECGNDLQPVRHALMTELRLHGHHVLPEVPLPTLEDALRTAVQTDLARATLAVHLVGSSPGWVPEGPGGQPLVALQAELGAARSAAASLPRVLWIAPGARGERPEHQTLLDRLQTDAALQRGADLLRGDAEALKATVHQTLLRLRQPPSADTDIPPGPRVHLVMTQQDGAAARPLLQALREQGLQPSVPAFNGDAAEVRRVNAQRVASAGAVLLLHGAGDEAWARAQASDLRKQAALAEQAPRRWTVVAAPRTEVKDELLLLEPDSTLDLLGGTAKAVALAVATALGATAAGGGAT